MASEDSQSSSNTRGRVNPSAITITVPTSKIAIKGRLSHLLFVRRPAPGAENANKPLACTGLKSDGPFIGSGRENRRYSLINPRLRGYSQLNRCDERTRPW